MAITIKNLNRLGEFTQKQLTLTDRRAVVIKVSDLLKPNSPISLELNDQELKMWEQYDLIYRTLCSVLFNFASSGHPGGSLSCSRFSETLLFHHMDYDLCNPKRQEADMLSFGAGHKAMGLYAMWALRNEIARVGAPELLPNNVHWQMRLEDLLGFRRNPITPTPHFKAVKSKALDGHAGPNVPFVPISTGPSGVATASSCGLAFGVLDTFPEKTPWVHIIEGEAGMSAGRVQEVLGTAATNRLHNVVLHLDWNQASIDSNRPTREGNVPGDYVQWEPGELGFTNDWNVILVDDGFDFKKVLLAQAAAKELNNGQPTMVVYRTVKGWKYGIEGKDSHGAGHKFCGDDYYKNLTLFESTFGVTLPRFTGEQNAVNVEECYWQTLMTVRKVVESHPEIAKYFGGKLRESRDRLNKLNRQPRPNFPSLATMYADDVLNPNSVPTELKLEAKAKVTLRAALGQALSFLNHKTGGALIGSAADLYGSTSLNLINKGFPDGFYDSKSNPLSRQLSMGGICEDSMGAFMTGVSAFGNHIGVAASYAAFIAGFEHVATRVHCIGQQLKQEFEKAPYNTFIMINGHAGTKTGEDGPTHADPQCLQLLQENFVKGTCITLTPMEPSEIWPALAAALKKRPAVLAPFVTRPTEVVPDRVALGLAPAVDAQWGVYRLCAADPKKTYHGTVIIQGSESGLGFIEALPKLREEGININAYYVSSAELFDLLPTGKQNEILPPQHMYEAMGISGFTLATLYRWILSPEGRAASIYPFKQGHYLGSGPSEMVVKQAGLDGNSQFHAIKGYAQEFVARQTANKPSGKRSDKGNGPLLTTL